MKTIKQIADSLGVSKQRVYRYIKKNHINEAHRDAGVMYYDDAVETQIKQAFNQNEVHQRSASRSKSNDTVDVMLEMLQKDLKTYEKQLDEKDKQIADITKSLQFEQGKNKELQDKVMLLESKKAEDIIESETKTEKTVPLSYFIIFILVVLIGILVILGITNII